MLPENSQHLFCFICMKKQTKKSRKDFFETMYYNAMNAPAGIHLLTQISFFPRGITVKNHQTWAKFDLTCIVWLITCICSFNFIYIYMYIPSKARAQKTKRKYFFISKFKGHNSVKNHHTIFKRPTYS